MSPLLLDGKGTAAQGTGTGLGVVELTSTAVSGEYSMIRGDNLAIAQAAADGFWFRTKIALRSITSIFVEAGLCDDDRSDYVRLLFDTSVDASFFRFESHDGSTQNAATLPDAPTADTFAQADIIFVPNVFAACWINGSGPHPLTANLPSTSLTPYVLVGTRTSATKTLRVENVLLDAISGDISNPASDELLTATAV